MIVLLVLMMFGWAGCTQQEEPIIEFLKLPTPPDTLRAKFVRDSTVDANTTWKDGIADTTWRGATSFGGQSDASRLYSTEYEVCQVRGHDIRECQYVTETLCCRWCWIYIKVDTIEYLGD